MIPPIQPLLDGLQLLMKIIHIHRILAMRQRVRRLPPIQPLITLLEMIYRLAELLCREEKLVRRKKHIKAHRLIEVLTEYK